MNFVSITPLQPQLMRAISMYLVHQCRVIRLAHFLLHQVSASCRQIGAHLATLRQCSAMDPRSLTHLEVDGALLVGGVVPGVVLAGERVRPLLLHGYLARGGADVIQI